jgi:hypothetical protein
MESETNIAVSIVMNFFGEYTRVPLSARSSAHHPLRHAVGISINGLMSITSVLCVDLFPGAGGAITASVSKCEL